MGREGVCSSALFPLSLFMSMVPHDVATKQHVDAGGFLGVPASPRQRVFSLALVVSREGKSAIRQRRSGRASVQRVILANLHQRTLTWPVHMLVPCKQILLLGAGESGKSTFAKQLNLLTKGKLADAEITLYRRGGWQQGLP